MLVFVLEDHPEYEAVLQQRRVRIEIELYHPIQHDASYSAQIVPALTQAGERQLVTNRARILERIVDAPESLGSGAATLHVLDEPHFLEVSDVPQVPYDGTHQRVVLAAQVVVRKRRDEQHRPTPGLGEEEGYVRGRERVADLEVHVLHGWMDGEGRRKVGGRCTDTYPTDAEDRFEINN